MRPVIDDPRPEVRRQGRDAGLVLGDDVRPSVRQRFAAYAVVTSSRGLLATEYSDRTAVTGRWGMPGGGLDDHEPPTSAVLREVAEETSQEIILGELIKVQTSHWVGRSPYGSIEDFHAVRLIYRASCPHPTDPVVVDEGGTTESARWVPLNPGVRCRGPRIGSCCCRICSTSPDLASALRQETGHRYEMLMSLSRSCRVSTPTGLPSSRTSNASQVLSTSTASPTGSVTPSIGSGSSMTRATASAGRTR